MDAIPSAFKKEYEKLLPCTCGCKRREHWSKWVDHRMMAGLKCTKCGKLVWGKSEVDARREWNKDISDGSVVVIDTSKTDAYYKGGEEE